MPENQNQNICFIKQYGEIRTGTNLIRALIKENFSNTEVLMHVLGDKHSLPVDYKNLRNELIKEEDLIHNKLIETTWSKSSKTTVRDDRKQIDYIKSIADLLKDCIVSEAMIFLISIKNPYAWAASALRISGWQLKYKNEEKRYLKVLEESVNLFNIKYKSWIGLEQDYPGQTFVVRQEDLIENQPLILKHLKNKFNLNPVKDYPKSIEKIVLPTHWDNTEIQIHFEHFGGEFYLEKQYMRTLTPAMLRTLEMTIDWQMLEALGYRPERINLKR